MPVPYDGEDLDEVAALTGCDRAEVVRRHTGQRWTVAFCGFAPGFGYLTGDDRALRVPRRSDPAHAVPAGSVALAGEFSGVYPRDSPGGWQLIGRTDASVRPRPATRPRCCGPATRVRFVEAGAVTAR